MWKNTRPWLRYIEGIDGAQAGATGTPTPPEPQEPAPAPPEKGGDQNGDKTSGDEPPAPAPEPVVTPPEPAGDPEPPAKPAAKPDTDDPRDTELEAMRQQLKELSEWRDKEVARARDSMAADVAKAAGLPDGFASRLRGDSREQLEADAKELAAVIGHASGRGAVDPSQGKSGGPGAATIEDAIKAHYGIN